MIIYNVTINIDDSVHDEWLQWMREVHIPEVLQTNLFVENRILKVLGEEDMEGVTYSIQYTCKSMDDYEKYKNIHAPELQRKHTERYKDKFVSFRTLLEII
jgi:hypothetical protein